MAFFHVAPDHSEPLNALGLDSLGACLAYTGGISIKNVVSGRDVRRVEFQSGSYFLKRVRGRGREEIRHEYDVLVGLHAAGLPVPRPVAVGSDDTAALMITEGLETLGTLEWLLLERGLGPLRLHRIVRRVADLLRCLHQRGVNHRDFYLGHLLVDSEDAVYVVDFGRAEVRRRVPWRRRKKDLAALHQSTPERVLSRSVRFRFLRLYLDGRPSRRCLLRWARAIDRKARRMRRHVERMVARGKPNVHVNS